MRRHKKNTGKKIIALCMCAGLLGICSLNPYAAPSDEIRQEIDEYNDRLSDSEAREQELEEEIAELETEEAELELQIEEQQKIVDKQQDDMALRIKYFYEESQGLDSFFKTLLSAASFSDLLNAVMYEQNIYEYDEAQLQEYQDAKQKLNDQQQEYLATGKELAMLVKEQEELQEELKDEISDKEREYEEAMAKEEEERRRQEEEALKAAQETQIATGDSVGSFQGYPLTEDQIRGIAVICEREQGTSASGVSSEASLIANRYQMHGSKYSSVYSYVADSGWWGKKAGSIMTSRTPKSSSVEIVRDVIVNGNRTLPANVDEHDCISDITSVSNNGVSFDKNDRSQYISGVTKIHNRYSSTYTFYCFAHSKGDPFGYTKN